MYNTSSTPFVNSTISEGKCRKKEKISPSPYDFFLPFTHSSTKSRLPTTFFTCFLYHVGFFTSNQSRLIPTSLTHIQKPHSKAISHTKPPQSTTLLYKYVVQNPISPSKISISNSRKITSTTSYAATPKDIHSGHRRVHVKPINLQASDATRMHAS